LGTDEEIYNHLIHQLTSQIENCTSTATYFYSIGDKNQALAFHKHKKNFTSDLAAVQSQRASKQAPPRFHTIAVEFKMENSFPNLSAQDLEIMIVRGIGLSCKDVSGNDLEAYVAWDFGWPTEGPNMAQGKGTTPTAKRTMNPGKRHFFIHSKSPKFLVEFNFSKVIRIDRNKAFQRFVERRKATFDVWHYRGFLRKDIPLGKVTLKLDDLVSKSEIYECIDVCFLMQSKYYRIKYYQRDY
jgi:hypothetical protein